MELGGLQVGVAIVVAVVAVYFTQSWIVNKRKRAREPPQTTSSSSPSSSPSSVDELVNSDDIRRLRLQRFESNKESTIQRPPSSSQDPSSSSSSTPQKHAPQKQAQPQPTLSSSSSLIPTTTTPPEDPSSSSYGPSPSTTPLANSTGTNGPTLPNSGPKAAGAIVPPSSALPPAPPLSPEIVIHNIICSIFAVTIQAKSIPGVKAFYLPELGNELATAPSPYVETEMADSIIVERTIACSRNEAIEYFMGCYKRALKSQTQHDKDPVLNKEIQEIKEFIARYTGLVLTNSFPEASTNTKEAASLILVPYLEGTASEDIPIQFLQAICSQYDSSEIHQVFGPIFTFLYGKLVVSTLVNNFIPQLRALLILTSVPVLIQFFVRMKNFIPITNNGYTFEQVSTASALFRFTPMLDIVGQFYFSHPQQMARTAVETTWSSIRLTLQPYHEILDKLSRNLLKVDTRERYLSWFAALLDINRSRTKMHFDRSTVSSDGFLANVNCVLMTLCEPFTSTVTDKWKSIDSNYIVHNSRISFANETKLGVSDEEVKHIKQQLEEDEASKARETQEMCGPPRGQYNFITESFFLTLYSLHVGIITTGSYYIELNQTLVRILDRKKQFQAMLQTQYTEHAIHQLDKQADALLIMQLAIDSVLANPRTVQQTTSFYAFTAEWLLKLLDPEQSGKLVAEPPSSFKFVPEFVVEDLMAYIMWMIRVHPDMLIDAVSLEKFVRFAIHLIASPKYIRNPYLRSKLAGFLAEFVPKEGERAKLGNSNLFSIIATHPLAHTHLVPGLISLYIDIEVTGRNSQFYDKLFVRREIALLLKHLRNFNEFITSLKNESKNTTQFLKFLHMLLGDAQYLVDEILIKLKDIKHTISEMQDQVRWSQLDDDYRREREQTHTHTEGQVKTFCILANETIDLLVFFTGHVKSPFLERDMAERLANMVNYFLAQLVGPKCMQLKLDNPEKYAWKPRELLIQIIRIYLNLANVQAFVTAVGSDERSYKLELFNDAARILRRDAMIPEQEIQQLEKLVLAAQEQAVQIKLQGQEIMNAPEEFIDPLLGVIMEDPVILPTSGMTVDRATIMRHLMSVPTDPFSRTPLSEDMLSPNAELQAKIEEWKKQKQIG